MHIAAVVELWVNNDPEFPKSGSGQQYNYLADGDSGSVSLLRNSEPDKKLDLSTEQVTVNTSRS